jgi:hypothetical protein
MTERPAAHLPFPPDFDRVLRAQDWEGLRKRLYAIAKWRKLSSFQASEIVDAVIVDCCDPNASPWNPNVEPDLVRHALRVLGNRLSDERRKDLVRSDPRNVAVVSELTAPPATPDQLLEDVEKRARDDRVIELTRAHLSGGVDAQVFDLSLDGIDGAAEQATRLQLPIDDIRRARKRVKYAIRAAIDDEASLWTNASDLLKIS